MNDPRYTMRPTEGEGVRFQEIFDTLTREIVGTFREKREKPGEVSEALELARKFLDELNQGHERTVQIREARHALIQHIDGLPPEALLRFYSNIHSEHGGDIVVEVYASRPRP